MFHTHGQCQSTARRDYLQQAVKTASEFFVASCARRATDNQFRQAQVPSADTSFCRFALLNAIMRTMETRRMASAAVIRSQEALFMRQAPFPLRIWRFGPAADVHQWLVHLLLNGRFVVFR